MQTMIAPATVIRSGAEEIRQQLSDGQRLINSGQLGAAAILLWSAFEAAVRLSLTEIGRQTEDSIGISDSPYGLCIQAVAYGVIDPEDRDVLLRFVPVVDTARHADAKAIDAGLLQEVSRFTKRTLDEMSSSNKAVKIVSGDQQMPVTISDVIAFINTYPGRTFYTTGKSEKPFVVNVNDRNFVYTLSSGNTYSQPRSDMEQLLQRYAEIHSLTPSEYHHPERPGSRFSSYFVGLMSALESGRSAEDS